MSDELLGTVAHVEEIGVRRDTYLDEFVDEFNSQLNPPLCVFFVETKAEGIGRFLVGVECVNQILAPDIAANGVVVEFSGVRDVLAGFVREGVVDNDDTFTAPLRVVRLLEKL